MIKYLVVACIALSVTFIFGSKIYSSTFKKETVVEENNPSSEKIFVYDENQKKLIEVPRVRKSKEEWKKELDPLEYEVMWEHGTEHAFTGDLLENKKHGIYICRSCKTQLFDSETKFNSGTGWPSFFKPVDNHNVATTTDKSVFMERIEVHCARCGAHLGHVFPDGPKPTGLRYCINSVSLDFEEKK